MRKTTRQILFFFFAGAFLVSAPLVVLYTAGYRISLNNYRVLETGALATSTSPRGATVIVDGKKDSEKTPTVVQNILPHDTKIRFEKTGYLPWEQTVPVNAGRTSYVSAILYADASSEKMTTFGTDSVVAHSTNGRYLLALDPEPESVTVTLYDDLTRFGKNLGTLPANQQPYSVVYKENDGAFIILSGQEAIKGYSLSGEPLSAPALSQAQTSSPVILVNNGKNIEVRPTRNGNQNILALLNPGNYTVVAADEEYVVLRDDRRLLTVVSLSGGHAVTLDVPAAVLTWQADLHLLAWSDGIEVNGYDTATGEKTFFARQSNLITTLAWHPSGTAVLVGTVNSVTAIDKEAFNNRVSTLLIDSKDALTDMWLDRTAKTLFILKDIDGLPTLERRKLVQ